jgi:exopolysaccharide biosynthesis polyprenyl glycosylphosphotransferase
LVLGDIGIAWIAYQLAFILRSSVYIPVFRGLLPMGVYESLPHIIWLVMISQFVWLHLGGVYDNTDVRQGIFPQLLRATTVHVLFLIAVYYVTQKFGFPRSVFLTYYVLDLVLLTAWHSTIRRLFRHRGSTRVLLVGLTRQAEQFISRAEEGGFGNIDLVGVVSAGGEIPSELETFAGQPILGTRDDLPNLIREHQVDEVLITPEDVWQDSLIDALSEEGRSRARILVIPSTYEAMIGRLEFLNLEDLLTLELSRDPSSPSYRAAKRILDTLGALVLLVVFSPLLLITALITKLQDGGPIFFIQRRVGQNERLFNVVKFRSMRPDAESETGPVLASEGDPRVTPWGRFMRAMRLDETPQLLNVLRGELSFVGPRPERPEFVEGFSKELHGYRERFQVKPGLTGLAQIHGDYLSTAENKLKYDLAYIYHQNLWIDVVLLLETLQVVITRKGK